MEICQSGRYNVLASRGSLESEGSWVFSGGRLPKVETRRVKSAGRYATVAQTVELGTENPRVGGSIPSRCTASLTSQRPAVTVGWHGRNHRHVAGPQARRAVAPKAGNDRMTSTTAHKEEDIYGLDRPCRENTGLPAGTL